MNPIDLLLINPPFHMRRGGGSFLPLGIGYIVSAVRASGFTVDIINCSDYITSFYPDELEMFETNLRAKLQKYSPILIGIGPCITSQIKALKIICEACREICPEAEIVCGGPLATMPNQEWVFFEFLKIKYIIKGDAEDAIPHLLSTLKNNLPISCCKEVSYSGYTKINEITDIDSIRFPYRLAPSESIISLRRQDEYKKQVTLPMISSRGCVYSCSYCVSGSLFQPKFRKRSYENIIDEMLYLKESFHATDIVFYDDCFFHNPLTANDDVRSFCSLLLARNIKMSWQIELRTDLILSLNETSIEMIDETGCRQINIGIEKTSDKSLKSIGKNSSIVGIRKKNQYIAKHSNIQLTGTFILGGPSENEASTRKLINDAKTLSLSKAHFSPLFLYPGTKLYDTMGYGPRYWLDFILNDKYPWGEMVYESKDLSQEQLMDLEDYAYAEFYNSSKTEFVDTFYDRYNLRRNAL